MTSMQQTCTTSTLTVQGITWTCHKLNGRIGFRRSPHAIMFDPRSGYYQIKEHGEVVFVARSVSECLENAAEIVWEYHANLIVPSWEAA